MNARSVMQSLRRGEVAQVDAGTEHLRLLREREQERVAERDRLRGAIDEWHPELAMAVRRRRKVM